MSFLSRRENASLKKVPGFHVVVFILWDYLFFLKILPDASPLTFFLLTIVTS